MTRHIKDTLWIRCNTGSWADVAQSLSARLMADGDQWQSCLTGLVNGTRHPRTDREFHRFVADNAIKGLLWLGGAPDSTTLAQCDDIGLPIGVAGFTSSDTAALPRHGLLRRRRPRLDQVRFWAVQGDQPGEVLNRAGVSTNSIYSTAPLVADVEVLPHNEEERHRIATRMQSRPAWCAAGVIPSEIPHLVQAYRQAARAAHRLLLIVAPSVAADETVQALRDEGLIVTDQALGDDPEEVAQAYVTDGLDELGLFYRLASITFMGGSFTEGARLDPYHPAALGSAVIAGPSVRAHAKKFERLKAEGAMLPLKDPAQLGTGVSQLLSVDRTAKMAIAGWRVTTEGGESLTLIQDLTRTHLLEDGHR